MLIAKRTIKCDFCDQKLCLDIQDKVWAFQYNSCVHESAFATVSLHKTAKGAYNAMRKHILKEYEEWRENGLRYGKHHFKHGEHEDWRIVAIPILE